MSSYTTKCPSCEKRFKTLYSLAKHVRERHDDIDENFLEPRFFNEEGKESVLPKPPETLDRERVKGYQIWLNGMTERLNSTFHPRLPGKYTVLYAGSGWNGKMELLSRRQFLADIRCAMHLCGDALSKISSIRFC